ncbi:AfsR/SARP family transcriptional regulator [Streptomyces sp. AK02-04a]|uniref:AfsR/SARP family transcriptional regulator n=1 Tax=Streptomyces sp. AK02-04a TaxID=3028649 RepID=UPI0029BD6FC2|nr:BTAD domain-containing putative transcriptional regulator [Streptomyces sp. AK02-04a]MDX3763520.1 BTAD domain-containing putative transcriptional regulator [Streptomyces sp. AK02-04a]
MDNEAPGQEGALGLQESPRNHAHRGPERDVPIDVRLLGRFSVRINGLEIRFDSQKQAVLLASLVLSPQHFAPREVLAAEVWPQEPPSKWPNALEAHISRLRGKLIGAVGSSAVAVRGGLVVSTPFGYQLMLRRQETDLGRLSQACDVARVGAREDPGRAAAVLHAELCHVSLPVLHGLAGGHLLQGASGWLNELVFSAFGLLCDLEIQAGRPERAIEHLGGIVWRHPLREDIQVRWMLALHAAGRSGEALSTYQRVRQIVARELGVAPSPVMRAALEEILRSDARGTRSS